MKKSLLYITVFISALFLAGCGQRVFVNPGEVGRELTADGFKDEYLAPGSYRLDYAPIFPPKIVRLQTTKDVETITINSLFLPKSNVDLANIEVSLQFQIKGDKSHWDTVYREIKPERVADREMLIDAEDAYRVFASRKAPDAILAELRNYNVESILTQVPEIADACQVKVNEMLKGTPVIITELGFPNGIGEIPDAVLEAKRRLYAVEEEQARRIAMLESELKVEEKRQVVQRVRATNDIEIAERMGITVSEYSQLKILERFADAAETSAENNTPFAIGNLMYPTKVE